MISDIVSNTPSKSREMVKPPNHPPCMEKVLPHLSADRILALVDAGEVAPSGRYLHWDELRHRRPPADLSSVEWWVAVKLARKRFYREVPGFVDETGRPFVFLLPPEAEELLHLVDSQAAGRLGVDEAVVNDDTRARFVFSSLAEEAISSSLIEGAVTTRQVARDMLRSGRRPRDHSERMIINNFRAMEAVRRVAAEPLSLELLLKLHRTLTAGTLENEADAGRIQRNGDRRVEVVDARYERILHRPPPADRLPERLQALVAFANSRTTGNDFIHPLVKAIILHFWLAYEHPFVDGNGRTARALFYWAALRERYWLLEFVSISRIIQRAKAQYYRTFLFTQTDDNDLTYFILHQLRVLRAAIKELNRYIRRKVEQVHRIERLLRETALNHRQIALLGHAIRHPGHVYTIRSHQRSHAVAYATARADLLELAHLGLLERRLRGRLQEFSAPHDLERRLRELQR